ncbi:MAG: M48 family metallopeptidase [Chitinophagaceae bacterium]|nr:M48 family metallopeptidase [Chitinophagaceae bacterium]
MKFIFTVTRVDRTGSIEVTEAEQPVLFAFIRQVATDTLAPFPKKIYLSSDVNAFVSYDSSFWSMFFPVRKNLTIGLGLVNSVNLSEFKAVLAHEFGHFSQRSMKLGSYVYNVNRILYNMLYDNTGYANMLQGWSSIHDVFALFTRLTILIARGIQAILSGMYGFLNKKYSGLSLQMEYHADAVAASVSGSESLVTALRRLELAGSGFQMSLQECDAMVAHKKRNANIYPLQSYCMSFLARENNLPMRDGLPYVTDQFLTEQNQRRVTIKDQWASHPPTEDRVKALRNYNVAAIENTKSAWAVFRDEENLQRTMTVSIYGNLADDKSITEEVPQFFQKKLEEDIDKKAIPKVYNRFYSNRVFSHFTNEELNALKPADLPWDEVYSKHFPDLFNRLSAIDQDIELLKQIAANPKAVRSFDFDGAKYNSEEATAIADKLSNEKGGLVNKIKEADANSIRLALYKVEKENGSSQNLRDAYARYFSHRDELLALGEFINEMMLPMQPIYAGQTMEQHQINVILDELRDLKEPLFKEKLRIWKERGILENIDDDTKSRIENYLTGKYVYFDGTSFMNTELLTLHEFANLLYNLSDRWVANELLKLIKG